MNIAPLPRANSPLKNIVFMGSPAFAVPSLHALHTAGFNITTVYTQPPRPAGRGLKLTPTAVHLAAEGLGLMVKHPTKLINEALAEVLTETADAYVVVAYGLLLPSALVRHKPCINVHPSALPKYRGAAPLQHTLLNGETSTEICIMQLDEGMDTGPVFRRTTLEVEPNTSFTKLHEATSKIGAKILVTTLQKMHTLTPEPQMGEATHASKITTNMRQINWAWPADKIHNTIRALGGVGVLKNETFKLGASTQTTEATTAAPGTVLGLRPQGLAVAAGGGSVIALCTLQRAGQKVLPASFFKDLTE